VTDIAAAYPCGFFVSAPDAAQFLRRFYRKHLRY